MLDTEAYMCPDCRADLVLADGGLGCANKHFFPFAGDGQLPVFASEDDDVNEYTIEKAAEVHDNALKWLFLTYGGSEKELRERLVARLGLTENQRVLVTGVGGGERSALYCEARREGRCYICPGFLTADAAVGSGAFPKPFWVVRL